MEIQGGNEAYHLAHDAMFAAGPNLSTHVLRNIATQAGVNMENVTHFMQDPSIGEILNANMELAQTLTITGTPGLVLKDGIIRGAVPQDQLMEFIDLVYTQDPTSDMSTPIASESADEQ